MKNVVVVGLILFGLYWMVDHYAPMPLNHEQFGLYEHGIRRLIGVVLFIAAGLVWLKWKPKKEK